MYLLRFTGLVLLMVFVAFCCVASCEQRATEPISARDLVVCVAVSGNDYPDDIRLVLFNTGNEQVRPPVGQLELRGRQWCTAPLLLAPGPYPYGARFDLEIHGSRIHSVQIYSGAPVTPDVQQAILMTRATRNRQGVFHLHLDFPPEDVGTAFIRVNPVYHPARLVPPE